MSKKVTSKSKSKTTTTTMGNSTDEKQYVDGMDDKERLAFEIAKDHLGSSFDLSKSIGFKKFVDKKK